MISLIKWVIVTIFNILPDSPFTHMVDELELNRDFLQYLNWFLPLDIVGNMIIAWLDCVLLYVIFFIVWKIIKLLIGLKLKGIFSAFKFIGKS
ncbi:MAG: hypothetical protein HDR04_13600 [Lachnospiraceae bacterium]|nr:hypothetical protein [Lachnospiraceae bacterium]